jgi:Protein of unknown function (DUF4242)
MHLGPPDPGGHSGKRGRRAENELELIPRAAKTGDQLPVASRAISSKRASSSVASAFISISASDHVDDPSGVPLLHVPVTCEVAHTAPGHAGSYIAADFNPRELSTIMRKFVIERDMPAIGTADRETFKGAAQKSNAVLKELGPDIQWVESHVTANKIFCIYLATDEKLIHRHAEISGFPANKVTEVKRTIDPTTASG